MLRSFTEGGIYLVDANGVPSGVTWRAHLRLLRKMTRRIELKQNIGTQEAFAACVAVALSVATFIHGKRLE